MSASYRNHLRPKNNFISANYKELIGVIGGIVLVLAGRFAIQSADPTAGVSDYGMLDTVIFAMCAVLATCAFVWGVLRGAFKTFSLYLDSKEFRADFFEKLNPNVRVAATLFVIFFLFQAVIQFAQIFAGTK